MYKLGITGGIGSGKSTAAEFFMRKGAVVFDADVEAKHHIQKTESVQKLIIHNFGSQTTTDNHLDLNKLSEIETKTGNYNDDTLAFSRGGYSVEKDGVYKGYFAGAGQGVYSELKGSRMGQMLFKLQLLLVIRIRMLVS